MYWCVGVVHSFVAEQVDTESITVSNDLCIRGLAYMHSEVV